MLSFRYNFYDIIDSDSKDKPEQKIDAFIANDSSSMHNNGSVLSVIDKLPVSTPLPLTIEETVDSEFLEDEETVTNLQDVMNNLRLEDKLPKINNDQLNSLVVQARKLENKNIETPRLPTPSNTTIEYQLNKSEIPLAKNIVNQLISSLNERFESLELSNKKEVDRVIQEKKRREVERLARIEAERKRKEEEEKRKKAEEERIKQEFEAKEKAEQERIKQEKLKAEKEAKKKEEAHKLELKKQAELKAQEEEREANRSKYTTNFKTIEKKFLHYKEQIHLIKKDIVEPVKQLDKEQKKILSGHRRKINPKFGQLTNSNHQLQAIANELQNLISQAEQHPLMFKFLLNFTAKAIVHQAENEVRVKPESSVPLAKLALFLIQKFPDLQELLMVRFVKKCPFVIGYTCSIDTENGRSAMGWKRNSVDKWEATTSYDERIGGMMTLFSVITRLDTMIPGLQNPWSLDYSWMILARIANTPAELLTNVHFIVLGSWWDAAAAHFLHAYGNQGAKLLKLIGDNLTSVVADRKYVGAARLRILMEDWVSNNNITSFPEMDP
ncbi:hypothetical protein C6P45_002068 [Maudiozyma exigua]|uniref:mRNA export factor GLE1 n=1 Tax=Maudiozyma exigua TaxID=34358 RepID=A0A9P6W0H1_MAUEX|nr:hypothetical protein C6P45_002068 [Kazachstania exigua]